MDAVIILLCGIPGAGKTTIARRLAALYCAGASGETPWDFAAHVTLDCISFDELNEQRVSAPTTAFDPVQWKHTQNEMERLVREQLSKVRNSLENVCRVLLVDDNFHYRSMRKRFYHVAEAEGVGFGIIHVATRGDVCRARNAAREGSARVPDAQFERMSQVFEPPDSSFSFDRNVAVLGEHINGGCDLTSTGATTASSDPMEALSRVLHEAAIQLEARRVTQHANSARLCLQIEDQRRTADNVVHNFDLASRKWISSVLNSKDAAFTLASKDQRTTLAKILNQRRKSFLLDLKTNKSSTAAAVPRASGNALQLLEHFRADMIREFSAA